MTDVAGDKWWATHGITVTWRYYQRISFLSITVTVTVPNSKIIRNVIINVDMVPPPL